MTRLERIEPLAYGSLIGLSILATVLLNPLFVGPAVVAAFWTGYRLGSL